MNNRFENNKHRNENVPGNIKSTLQKVNADVVADENLKTRSRSGGYVAWPQREPSGRTKENRKPGAR